MRGLKLLTLLGCGAALWSGPGAAVYGQGTPPGKDAPPPLPPPLPATFSMTVKDGPVRAALTELFEAAHIQYSLDERVTGFETLRIVDQPFSDALRVLLRSSSLPLTYTLENGVYYIKPRVVVADRPESPPLPTQHSAAETPASSSRVDVLTLTHADPYDLAPLFGIKIVPFGTRFSGMASGGGSANSSATGPAKAGSSGASGTGSSSVINGGTLISNDADNDILRIGD